MFGKASFCLSRLWRNYSISVMKVRWFVVVRSRRAASSEVSGEEGGGWRAGRG